MIDSISDFLGQVLIFFYQLTGNYAYSIVLFSVAIKLSLLYFTHQQYKSMKDMQKIQPVMKEIQEKYKNNPEKLNKIMMGVWKHYNVNPLGGCLPLLIQMPIIYALYRTIENFKFEFTHTKFLWIGSVSEGSIPVIPYLPFLGNNIPLFGSSLFSSDLPLVIIYGLSMYLSQVMTVNTSPQQGPNPKVMAIIMSVFITFVMFKFQSALILYWLIFNLLSILQQYIMLGFTSKVEEDKKISLEEIERTILGEEEVDSAKKKIKKKK